MAEAFQRPWPTTRRGLCLWLFSLSFIFLGMVNYVITTPPPTSVDALAFVTDIAPIQVWGSIMALAGLIAMGLSYYHYGRDKYGFILLATFCGAWGLVYWCGFFFYGAGLRAVSSSIIWLLFSGILQMIAGFPNVPLKADKLHVERGS